MQLQYSLASWGAFTRVLRAYHVVHTHTTWPTSRSLAISSLVNMSAGLEMFFCFVYQYDTYCFSSATSWATLLSTKNRRATGQQSSREHDSSEQLCSQQSHQMVDSVKFWLSVHIIRRHIYRSQEQSQSIWRQPLWSLVELPEKIILHKHSNAQG